MSNTKEDIDIIKEQKDLFASAFLDAVSTQSVEKCKKLILPFDEYKKLVDDKEMTESKYDEALTKQCINFFDKNKDYFDEHKTRLLEDKIDSCKIYDLGDKHEIADDFYYTPIRVMYINLDDRILENDDISYLGFQIDNPMVINSKLRINNFLFTKTYELIDNSQRIKKEYEKLGFKELPTDKFLEIVKGDSFRGYDEHFDMHDEYTRYIWFIYEGDLVISSEEFNKLNTDGGMLITGDLIVDGVLDLGFHKLFVLKNIKAKSIFIDSSSCYIGDTAYFDEVLIVNATDDEPSIVNNTKGKFVFSRLPSGEIKVEKENVDVFIDYTNDVSFGEVTELLKDEFLEKDEDYGYFDILHDELLEATLKGDAIFKK